MSSDKKSITKTTKLKTIILSVFFAVIVWFMVIYVNDPDITTTVSDLNVHLIGESALREKGLAVTGRDSIPSLSVVVSGKRSDLMNYMSDIYVQVNVSDITGEGEYKLDGAISLPTTRITVEKERYGEIPVRVEPLDTKEILVSVKQTGTSKSKMIKSEIDNPKVTITGARSEVEAVAGGVAEVDISHIHENGVQKSGYLLTDANGTLIDKNETLETGRAFVEIENTVYEQRILPVEALLTAELDKSYILKKDKTVTVPSELAVGVDSTYEGSSLFVYINALSPEGTGEYQIAPASGLYVPEASKTVRVKYEAVKKAVAQLELEVEPINTGQGLTARVENKLIAQVCGEDGKISDSGVKAFVDVKDLGAGEYTLPVSISGDNVSLQENYTVNVIIE